MSRKHHRGLLCPLLLPLRLPTTPELRRSHLVAATAGHTHGPFLFFDLVDHRSMPLWCDESAIAGRERESLADFVSSRPSVRPSTGAVSIFVIGQDVRSSSRTPASFLLAIGFHWSRIPFSFVVRSTFPLLTSRRLRLYCRFFFYYPRSNKRLKRKSPKLVYV